MRKRKNNPLLAILLAGAMLISQPGLSVVGAEELTGAEMAAEQAEEAPAEEAPAEAAPAVEEPVAEAEPEVPVTEAPQVTEPEAPVTEVPQVTEPETTTTEAPQVTEPETPATEKLTEAATEQGTEAVTETEAKTDRLTASVDGAKVTLQLASGKEVPVSSMLRVQRVSENSSAVSYGTILSALKKATNRGHRELRGAAVYTLEILQGEEVVALPGGSEVTFEYADGLALGLEKYAQGTAAVYSVSSGAEKLANLKLNGERKVSGFKVTGADLSVLAVAGEQNRTNDGESVTDTSLERMLKAFAGYAVVANQYTGPQLAGRLAVTDGQLWQDLTQLSRDTLHLANGKSSGSVSVVNVYTDADGKPEGEPLKAVLDDQKKAVDVTDHLVVINLVVTGEKNEIIFSSEELYNRRTASLTEEAEKAAATAGRILYNVVAESGNELTAFRGKVQVRGSFEGTLLVPEGTVVSDSDIKGAVYADTVRLGERSEVKRVILGAEPETETETEEVTEKATETETETETEEATERVTEPETETETEKVTEKVTETETETETEKVTEKVTETETITEAETEAVTEKATETETETETEKVTEKATETETETETEKVTEKVTETEVETEEATEKATETETETETEKATEKVTEAETETETEPGEVEEATESVTEEMTENFAPEVQSAITLQIGVRADSEAGAYLEGAQLAVRDGSTGEVLTDIEGNPLTFQSEAKDTEVVLDTDRYALLAEMEAETSLVLMISEIVTPTVGETKYTYANGAEIPITLKKDAEGKLALDETISSQIAFVNKQEEVISGRYTILIEQQLFTANTRQTVAEDTDTYVAVFSDEERTSRISDVTKITIKKGASSGSVTVSNLPEGVYYVGETDAYGKLIGDAEAEAAVAETFYAKYLVGSEESYQVDFTQQMTGNYLAVTIQNHTYAITVTKRLYSDGKVLYSEKADLKYYVMLYEDASHTEPIWPTDAEGQLVEKPYEITMGSGKTYASVTIGGLIPGTYYLAETDATGRLVGLDAVKEGYYAEYDSEDDADEQPTVIEIEAGKIKAEAQVTIKNHYTVLPEETVYTASFAITKNVVDTKGNPKNVKATFNIGIYDKDTGTRVGVKQITLNNESSKTVTATLKMRTATRHLELRELNSDNSALTNNEWKLGDVTYTSSISPAEITLSIDDATQQTVVVTNKEVEKEPETETEAAVDKAVLKLTKKVTYKGQAIRVNASYYIGIFDDAALTKLRYTKRLDFKNASEVTATLKINLAKAQDNEVTFYFAEVDAAQNGKPVGSSFGYEVSQNKTSSTLNAKNADEEIVFTNNVKTGGTVERQLTNASSGLAGDSAALAQAQQLSTQSNSGENTQTGDDTVIAPYQILLGVSAVLILAVIIVLILLRRKRR